MDRTFGGGDGWVATRIEESNVSRGHDVAIQPNGKIVVATFAHNESCTGDPIPFFSVPALIRYRLNGSLDPTFGGGGRVITRFLPIGHENSGYAGVAIQADGRIVVAGSASDPVGAGGAFFMLGRYLRDGTLDLT
jgi:uncharacterized delta-60 repeat protein